MADAWNQKAIYDQRYGLRCQACAHPQAGEHHAWCAVIKDRDLGDECDRCRQWEAWAASMPKVKR